MPQRRGRMSLMAFALLILVLSQADFNSARPSRGNNRRSKTKAKRTWQPMEDQVVVVAAPGNQPQDIIFPSPIADGDDDLKSPTSSDSKTVMKQWLELDRVGAAVQSAGLNSDLTLECVAVGSPPPRVFWLKDGKRLEHMTPFDVDQMPNHVFGWEKRGYETPKDFNMANVKSKLPLKCVRPEDRGEYSCVAENEGRQLVASTIVNVDDSLPAEPLKSECVLHYSYTSKKGRKIQPAFIMSYEYLHMDTIGNDAIINCHAVGRPRPQIVWVDYEGNALPLGKKFKTTESGSLIIKNLSWKEMGEYTCRAENDFGSDSASTFLYPLLSESSR